MKEEEEDMTIFLQKVDEFVSKIKGLGKATNEQEVVQKVLISLPIRFNPKVSAIKEHKHLEKLTIDALRGTLTTYEVRIGHERP